MSFYSRPFIVLSLALTMSLVHPSVVNADELNPVPREPVIVYVVDGGYSENAYFEAKEVIDFTKDKRTSKKGLDCERSWGSYHGNKTTSLIKKYSGEAEIEIISLKVLPCDSSYSNAYWNVYNALTYIGKNHQKGREAVVNLSITTGKYGQLLEIPLRRLEKLNIPVVVSSGNYGGDACNHYTAKSKRTITIGALDKNFTGVWGNSNTGKCVDFYAASYHTCIENGSKLVKCNGTSFSAPVVSAMLANYLYKYPNSKISDLKKYLASSSKSKSFKVSNRKQELKYFPTPKKR